MSGNTNMAYIQELLQLYSAQLRYQYFTIAASVLLWYDVALTLSTEYSRIWRQPFSGATVVYLVMRYTMVTNSIFAVLVLLDWRSSEQTCKFMALANQILSATFSLAFAGKCLILIRLLTGVVPYRSALNPMNDLPTTQYAAAKSTWKQNGFPIGCTLTFDVSYYVYSSVLAAEYATTVASYMFLIASTSCKTLSIKRSAVQAGVHTPITDLLLRDGTLHLLDWRAELTTINGTDRKMLLTLVAFIAWNTTFVRLPPCARDLRVTDRCAQAVKFTVMSLVPFINPVTSIMISRFMLDLRTLYFSDARSESDTTQQSTVRLFPPTGSRSFTSNIVGNLGATLRKGSHQLPGWDDGELDDALDTSAGLSGGTGSADGWDDELPRFCDDPFATGMQPEEGRD
ncbi:hypothetical protein GY45DRAFT_1335420 [Cubamyces sp. BRFM 1775]|nr:hypothetical protein GY45DRAFT_1335420 [Cubamyces sp. BRFM 1775]